MPPRDWDALWKETGRRSDWSEPDPDMVELLKVLEREKINRVLDIGCGVGRHLMLLSSVGYDTYGLDSSETAIRSCRENLTSKNLSAHVRVGDMHRLDYSDAFFDFVLAWNVIYHTTRAGMVDILSETRRVTRPGGFVYLTLNSTRNESYAEHQREGSPGHVRAEKVDDGHIHCYCDRDDVGVLLKSWDVLELKEEEETLAGERLVGSWHWIILLRRPQSDN